MANPSSAQPETHFSGLDAYHRMGGNSLYLHGEGDETHSREATGTWLQERGLRPELFLCTQVCHDGWDDARQCSVCRFTAEGLTGDIDKDLELLRVEHIDLVCVCDHPASPVGPVIDAVAREIAAGRVGAYGLGSNWSAHRVREAVNYARGKGIGKPATVFTTELSMLRATSPLWPEHAVFSGGVEEVVRAEGMAVFAHVDDINLGQCVFGDEDGTARARPHWVSRWQHPANEKLMQDIRSLAAERGLSTRGVNLQWVLSRPFPVVGIVGLPALLSERRRDYEQAVAEMRGEGDKC